jgi:hypothetical protein
MTARALSSYSFPARFIFNLISFVTNKNQTFLTSIIIIASTMVAIEYSPNGRASCKGCFCKIFEGHVRVSVKELSKSYYRSKSNGSSFKYFHAACYNSRIDFTKFYGWYDLRTEDQMKCLTEEQKKRMYPDDPVEANGPSSKKAKKGETLEQPQTAPVLAPPPPGGTKIGNTLFFTVVGTRFYTGTVRPGELVKLEREPDNVSFIVETRFVDTRDSHTQ